MGQPDATGGKLAPWVGDVTPGLLDRAEGGIGVQAQHIPVKGGQREVVMKPVPEVPVQLGQIPHEPVPVLVGVVTGCTGAGDEHGYLVADDDLGPQGPVALAEQGAPVVELDDGGEPGGDGVGVGAGGAGDDLVAGDGAVQAGQPVVRVLEHGGGPFVGGGIGHRTPVGGGVRRA